MAKIYREILGVGTGRFGFQIAMRTRLYQGPDHLLVVQSTGYTEEYRRIFYRDIRQVDIRDSRRLWWHAGISGVLIALIALLFLALPAGWVAFLIAGPSLWFVVNLIKGPACDCYVVTGVQTLRLPAPGRRAKVPRLIAFLRAQAGTPSAADSVPTA